MAELLTGITLIPPRLQPAEAFEGLLHTAKSTLESVQRSRAESTEEHCSGASGASRAPVWPDTNSNTQKHKLVTHTYSSTEDTLRITFCKVLTLRCENFAIRLSKLFIPLCLSLFAQLKRGLVLAENSSGMVGFGLKFIGVGQLSFNKNTFL